MTIQCFSAMAILSRKGLLGIAAVIDVALQEDEPISAKAIAARHRLPPSHLEGVLQSLVRSGILKGIRGPHGGYTLLRDRSDVTANDILRAAETAGALKDEPKSDLVAEVVIPVMSAVEQECGEALSRVSLDDMLRRAASGNGTGHDKNAKG